MTDILLLLEEAKDLKLLATNVQEESIPLEERQEILADLYERYHTWYRKALVQFERLNEADKKTKFEKEYEGGLILAQILSFLTEGLKVSVLYNPDNPQFSKWQHPVTLRFHQPFEKQCNILSTLQVHFEGQPNNKTTIKHPFVRVSKSGLKVIIETRFDKNDIIDLCFELEVDHQNFHDTTRRGMARELVEHMVKLNKLKELIVKVLYLRNLTQDELDSIFQT